ncbi:MAG: hypothetical protein LBL74_04820 [Bacteroidales bacterium]|nr:hypothetical protein [Bacteroidales bacterium]
MKSRNIFIKRCFVKIKQPLVKANQPFIISIRRMRLFLYNLKHFYVQIIFIYQRVTTALGRICKKNVPLHSL